MQLGQVNSFLVTDRTSETDSAENRTVCRITRSRAYSSLWGYYNLFRIAWNKRHAAVIRIPVSKLMTSCSISRALRHHLVCSYQVRPFEITNRVNPPSFHVQQRSRHPLADSKATGYPAPQHCERPITIRISLTPIQLTQNPKNKHRRGSAAPSFRDLKFIPHSSRTLFWRPSSPALAPHELHALRRPQSAHREKEQRAQA